MGHHIGLFKATKQSLLKAKVSWLSRRNQVWLLIDWNENMFIADKIGHTWFKQTGSSLTTLSNATTVQESFLRLTFNKAQCLSKLGMTDLLLGICYISGNCPYLDNLHWIKFFYTTDD